MLVQFLSISAFISVAENRFVFPNNSATYIKGQNIVYYESYSGSLNTLFEIFPRLYVEWEPALSWELGNILKEAANINVNQQRKGNQASEKSHDSPIQTGVIVRHLYIENLPFEVIEEVNGIFPNTVSAIIVSTEYNSNPEIVNPILQAAFAQKKFLRLGLLNFDCTSLENFTIPLLDFIHIIDASEGSFQKCYQFKKEHIKPQIYMFKTLVLEVDFNNPKHWILPEKWLNQSTKAINNNSAPYYHLFFPKTNAKPDCKLLPGTLSGNHQNFSRQFFGFSTYFDDFSPTTSPISALINRSPRIILENRKYFDSPVNIQLQMENHFQAILKEAFKSGYDITVNLAVRLNFWKLANATLIINITQQVLNAASAVNSKYYGVVSGVVVNQDDPLYQYKLNRDFDKIFLQLKGNVTSETVPKVGILYRVLDRPELSFGQGHPCYSEAMPAETPEFFVVAKSYWLRNQEICFDSKKFRHESIDRLEECGKRVQSKMKRAVEFWHYLDISCNKVNLENTTSLYHYANLLVAFNREALFGRKIVYTNNALEYKTKPVPKEMSRGWRSCGWWKLVALNSSNETFRIEDRIIPPDSDDNGNNVHPFQYEWLWWLLIPLFVFVSSFVATCILLMQYRNKFRLKSEEIHSFFHGDKNQPDSKVEGNNKAFSLKYDKEKFEISESNYDLDKNKCLGFGQFGIVYFGLIRTGNGEIQAAIKTTKLFALRNAASTDFAGALRSLLVEIKLLAYIGPHKNIVELLGANTEEIYNGKVFVFLEYCENGSLLKHLRALNPVQYLTKEKQSEELDIELAKSLVKWTSEIAEGMEYLALKRIVHADLAARNVLLDRNFLAKISDFGLSRRLYDYTRYVKKNQEPLPWQWMAPESLQRLEFGEKSDVWAYGVTIWEIYTFGEVPYAGLSWNIDFVSKLEAGLKLSTPRYNENKMYSIMLRCWNFIPGDRPTFSQLKDLLPTRCLFEWDNSCQYEEVLA